MEERRYTRTLDTGYTLKLAAVTFRCNDFSSEDHPELAALVRDVLSGRPMGGGDVTLEEIVAIEDRWIKEDWEKARWVAENIACFEAAAQLAQWAEGYRSDDGYDYLTTALDTARYLTNIDLSEIDFLMWWNYTPIYEDGHRVQEDFTVDTSGEYIGEGASDGEIRYMMFPVRWSDE